MNNRLKRRIILFLGLLFIIACKLIPQNSLTSNLETPQTTLGIQNHFPEKTQIFTSTDFPKIQLDDFVPSPNAGEFIGEIIVVRMENAYCSYRPDVNGAPTFCNDQPFPNHIFTLIAWGKDWSDLDGKCVYVEGEIEEYGGKFEIIVDSRDQVSFCD